MRLLVVSNAYTPAPNPRAFRWSAVAEHWAERGHTVDVVCAPVPGREAPCVIGGVNVHPAGGAVTGRLRHALARAARLEDAPSRGNGRAARGGPSILRRIYDATWRQVYWPDYACAWYPAARRTVHRLLAVRRYDGMVTVSVPFTGHLVGFAARKRHPELPWVADIGDPFSFVEGTTPNNQHLYTGLNRVVERRLFGAADSVAVTTDGTEREYAARYPESAGKVTVIPPLLSLPACDAAEGEGFFPVGDGKLRLVFVGTFYRTIRSPEFLLGLYRRLLASDLGPRLELHLLGSTHDCDDLIARHADLLGRSVFVHGVVDRDSATAAMRQADVLVNVGNENSYQLPSKVVEYVSTGRPILNLVAGERDSSHAFLRRFDACFAVPSDEALPPARFEALVEFLRKPPVMGREAIARAVAPFRTEAIAGAYEALIRQASHAAAGERLAPARVV
jgi:glycosyltransferase involved in cell wall biosynthesis